MRKTATAILGASAVLLVGTLLSAPASQAAGQAPDAKVCNDKKSPPKDAVTKGGCVVINRRKGNCMACHLIAGIPSGNVAPPMVEMQKRFPGDEGKKKLRAQIWDSNKANPGSVMPPFGRHAILTEQEIDDVVAFLLTL